MPTLLSKNFISRLFGVAACVLAPMLWLPVHADEIAEMRAMAGGGDLQGAIKRVEQSLKLQPRDARLRFLYGVLLMDAGRDEAALELFTQMSQEYPELADPYNNIALLQTRAGRLELALTALQDALRAEPGHRTAKANLGQLHLMIAVRTWESLAQTGPIEPALQRRLASARTLLNSSAIVAR
jgi:Flp pilus assembly protein TadD